MKTRSLLKLIFAVFIVFAVQNSFAGKKYWVKGTGDGDGIWDYMTLSNWSDTINGLGGDAGIPGANDTVYITQFSFDEFGDGADVYVTGTVQCYTIDLSLLPAAVNNILYFKEVTGCVIEIYGGLNANPSNGYSPLSNFTGELRFMASSGSYTIASHHYFDYLNYNSSFLTFPNTTSTATWELANQIAFTDIVVDGGTLKTGNHQVEVANFSVASSGAVIADTTVFYPSNYPNAKATWSVSNSSPSDFSHATISEYSNDTLVFNGGSKIYDNLYIDGKFKYYGTSTFNTVYLKRGTELYVNAGDTMKVGSITSVSGYTDDYTHTQIDTVLIKIINGVTYPEIKDVDGGDNCLYFTRVIGVATNALTSTAKFHANNSYGSSVPLVGPAISQFYTLHDSLNYFFNSVSPTCFGGLDGKGLINCTGGSMNYTAEWLLKYPNGEGYDYFPFANGLMISNGKGGSVYKIKVSDNFCTIYQDSEEFTILDTSTTSGPVFDGYILDGTDTVKYGVVEVFYNDGEGKYELVATASVDSYGYYYTNQGSSGDYILRYDPVNLPDTLLPSYYAYISGKDSAAYKWEEATPFLGIPCGAAVNKNIRVFKSLNQAGGLAKISGTVREGFGYQGFKLSAEGGQNVFGATDPIRQVGVGLGKVPGGGMLTVTQTDFNGNYSFDSIPVGTYLIYVDIPGLPHTAFHTVTVSGNDSLPNQDYFVDSANVFILPLTGVKYFVKESGNLKSYPNPYTEALTIQFEKENSSHVELQVFDVMGNTIAVLENKTLGAGSYQYRFSAKELGYSAGVYLVKLRIGNEMNTVRVIELE